MFKKNYKPDMPEKIIDIDAGLEGNVKFSSPLNLRISGKFEGELETQGFLTIGEQADVRAKVIKGENIIILGKVKGNIIATKRLELSHPAQVIGNIEAPILVVNEGVMLKGHCQVSIEDEKNKHNDPLKKKGPKKQKE